MTSKVLTIGTPVDELHERRLRAVAAAGERVAALTGALAPAGRIAVSAEDEPAGPWTLSYVPSPAALAAVAAGGAPSWGARVDAKQQKALRRAPGAVFRLPFADPATGQAGDEHLSTFT